MVKWFEGWRKREDLMPWMLWNYSIVLRRRGDEQEAYAVNTAALELRYDDTVHLHLTMIGLTEFKRGNLEEAAAVFSTINPTAMTNWERFYYDVLSNALLAYDRIKNSDPDQAKDVVRSIVSDAVLFDPKLSDKIAKDLVGGVVNILLDRIGNPWFTIRVKGLLFYHRYL